MINHHKVICIKIGGKAATDESAVQALVEEIREMWIDTRFIIVHGGGSEVTRISEALGYTPNFKDGIRMTSPDEMDVVDMVLSGKMNKYLVRRFAALRMRTVGISGSDGALFVGKRLDPTTHTGKIVDVDTSILELLLEREYLPIVASTSMTDAGEALNINADEAAFAIAANLPTDVLLFLSDIPGILTRDGEPISELDERTVAQGIADGTITGGMIPKVRASVDALRSGTGSIVIGRYLSSGQLHELLDGTIGTRVLLSGGEEQRLRSR